MYLLVHLTELYQAFLTAALEYFSKEIGFSNADRLWKNQ
jgi:hypothetical protein